MSKHVHFTDLKVERLPQSEAVITGSITTEYLAECRTEALKELGAKAKIPGFRPGHIPEEVLVKNIGEMHILEETAEIALGREYSHIVQEAKLTPIARPQVAITKLAPGIPLEFKITVALEPEFKLPDYKKIAKDTSGESEDLEVTEKEVADVVEELKKREVKADLMEGETLEGKVKENLAEEKKFRAKEKKRLKLVDELVKGVEIPLPRIMIEAELEKMFAQFKDDVKKIGMKWEDYLASIKKTEADIRTEWEPKAVDRAKAELIVAKIATEEKIEPTTEEVEHEAKHLLEHYPDADPLRARIYVYTTLRNHKVLEFLEGLK